VYEHECEHKGTRATLPAAIIIRIRTRITREDNNNNNNNNSNNVFDETDSPEPGNRVRNRALPRESVETFLREQLAKSEKFRFTSRRVRETRVGGEI
jgi:hypothetical protein